MNSIIEIKWNNTLSIIESIELIDKKKHYEAKFRQHNGHIRTEHFIKKSQIGIPFVNHSTWENILYVNSSKYYQNPEYYCKLTKEYRRHKDCRKWLKI
ncbi:hypothetical protein ACR77J_07625 [Tissierella praeacuta]|uniref:hypothetical protein n=1 Tax=Tissierella praeacuta TaxID=43131 RepID=UPI003DA23BD9